MVTEVIKESTGEQDQFEKLNALGAALATKRSEAINGRQSSGIEDIWNEDEDFYEGFDEMNRGEDGRGTWRQKPPGQKQVRSDKTTNSTVFPNITGPFTDAAAARIADMLLPTDDKNWGLSPTPVPDLVKMSKGKLPEALETAMHTQAQPHPGTTPSAAPVPAPGGTPPAPMPDTPAGGGQGAGPGAPQGGAPEQQGAPAQQMDPKQQMKAAAIQAAEEVMSEARYKAELAETRIADWHAQCDYNAEIRKVLEDSARIGTGVLKGPVPQMKRKVSYGEYGMTTSDEINPVSSRVDPWNFYPDPACGESIHNGSYCWERDHMTVRQLMDLLEDPDYIPEALIEVINEGPTEAQANVNREDGVIRSVASAAKHKPFEVWTYTGIIDREDMEAAGCDCTDFGEEMIKIPAVVMMINEKVVKASLNPLDTGDFPYDVMVWRRRANHWTGIGVARQIRTPQKMIVGATRHLMDNAGIGAGPMLIFKQGAVYPADGKMGLSPRKILYIAEDAETMDDVRKAVGTVKVDMVVDELRSIIELGMKFAEDTTGLPMLIQGQMGSAPDTVGGMTMLQNNATAVLRRMARTFDDRVTRPHLQRYYTWLLQWGDVEEEKGDYCVVAKGSTALVERDIQAQEIATMGQIVTDLRFGADPKKWFKEFLISRRYEPDKFAFDDAEWQEMMQKMSEPPPDPRLEVAQLNAESRERMGQLQGEIAALKEKSKQEIEVIKLQFEEQENAKDREVQILVQQIESGVNEAMARLREAGADKRNIDSLQQKIADTTQKLKTQVALADMEVVEPAAEPAGRAKPGKSFTQ